MRAYKTLANNKKVYSDLSNADSAKTKDTPFPHEPKNLVATATGPHRIKLVWADNSNNETNFKIYRDHMDPANPARFKYLKTVAKNVETYIDTGLSANTYHTYRVTAVNAKGESAYDQAGARTPAN